MSEKEAAPSPRTDHSLTPEVIAHYFKSVPLFQDVPDDELARLAAKAKTMFYPRGSTIFHMGDKPVCIYFLYSGYVTEFVAFGSSMNVIVKTRKERDYIGEMGILAGQPCSNAAIAMGDVTLITLSKEALLDIMQHHYSVSHYIILQLIDRLTNSAKRMVSTMYLDAPARLASTIVSLSSDMAGNHHNIAVTQSELAAACGTARQTAAKILGEWRRAGYIDTERGKLSILDIGALLDIITESESNL